VGSVRGGRSALNAASRNSRDSWCHSHLTHSIFMAGSECTAQLPRGWVQCSTGSRSSRDIVATRSQQREIGQSSGQAIDHCPSLHRYGQLYGDGLYPGHVQGQSTAHGLRDLCTGERRTSIGVGTLVGCVTTVGPSSAHTRSTGS
jgi:hypothetical protein